ncbi:hypothetical protein [Tessaracoccus defluvii]|uniref:Uncharacterized protein n=1 Tax=Tessaracoccus defluvii TaxID=1285901 RepID=A0A7H0H3C7_9ACTN|nr:hypothetical protein [Tessaracoccus defluvii]QNP55043.1 hypothetical protein H9L22_12270 [Tessaracoccus defluvii]
MTHGYEQVDPVGAKGISRRTVVKGAAWTAPVVAVAVAAPMAAASSETTPTCVAVRGEMSPLEAGVVLYHDGANECAAGTTSDGKLAWPNTPGMNIYYPGGTLPVYTTGFTPVIFHSDTSVFKTPLEDPATSDAIAKCVAGKNVIATSVHGLAGVATASEGFLSMDDRDNTAEASDAPVSFTVTYSAAVVAGSQYTFVLPVEMLSATNGEQLLKIEVTTTGGSEELSRLKFGQDTEVSTGGIEGYADYINPSKGENSVSVRVEYEITPAVAQTILFTYTFILPKYSVGTRQNADIWVQAPQNSQVCTVR